MTIRHTNEYLEEGYVIDLMPYMERDNIKPLIEEHIIESNKGLFRAERYHWTDVHNKLSLHCYVFIDITIGSAKRLPPSPKKPSYVAQALKERKIKITKVPYHGIT